ncbi:MAG: nucleotide exchange factor GrpE [Deltaproteobacteria bacterium]|jgi:molecular chaperone GrpE|nr:MAG: nucleotide exchange factor GrpE [Deltaproteobacteria bacterium]TNF24858.1 MAG: nucleotide exchange factor GrpE [Deltaproteobacteria bacterium]
MVETTSDAEKDLKQEMDEIKNEAEEIHADAKQIHEDAEKIKEETEELKEEIKELKEEMEAPQKEQEDFKSKYFYLAAEMENMRKRFDREKQNLLKFGNEKVLSDLIEVVDNLDRTLEALNSEEDEKVKNILTGVDMVRKQFLDVLTSNGLERIESVGQKFDPNFHEALAQQPAEGKEDDEILMEYQRGYILNGRLLRAAKVIVCKN